MTRYRMLALSTALTLSLATASLPVGATGIPVFDASNFAQQIQNVMHQVTQIQHMVTQIDNQVKALQGSAFSLSPQLTSSLSQIQETLNSATALTHNPKRRDAFAEAVGFREPGKPSSNSQRSSSHFSENFSGQGVEPSFSMARMIWCLSASSLRIRWP